MSNRYQATSATSVLKAELDWTIRDFAALLDMAAFADIKSAPFRSEAGGDRSWSARIKFEDGDPTVVLNGTGSAVFHVFAVSDEGKEEHVLRAEATQRAVNPQPSRGTKLPALGRAPPPTAAESPPSSAVVASVKLCSAARVKKLLLADDSLRLIIRVTWVAEGTSVASEAQPTLPSADPLDLSALLSSGPFSDVTVVVGEAKFPVHKAILGLRSRVFRRMFEQKTYRESATGVMEILDFDAAAVEAFLHFLYTGEADAFPDHTAELLALAEKYDVSGLKSRCGLYLGGTLGLGNAVALCRLAGLHNSKELKAACALFLKGPGSGVVGSPDWAQWAAEEPELAAELLEVKVVEDDCQYIFADEKEFAAELRRRHCPSSP